VFEKPTRCGFRSGDGPRREDDPDEAIAHELATYTEQIPDRVSCPATPSWRSRARRCCAVAAKLFGVQDHVVIEVAGEESRSEDRDPSRLTREDEITTTVHYVKFTLSPQQQEAFAEGPVRIRVDHPAYRAEVELGPDARRELAGDLASTA